MLSSLQIKLLDMLRWLDKFLRGNGLTYYVVGGTLLGAVRHKGFIPWDDDVDIAMPRNDYKKLCILLERPIEHYVVESTNSIDKNFLYTFAKFYDLNTSMTEVLRKKVRRGVYIDIFPIDGIGNSIDEALSNYKKLGFLNDVLNIRKLIPLKGRKWYKNLCIRIIGAIPLWIINDKKLAMKIDTLNQIYPYCEMKYVGVLSSVYGFKDVLPKTVYGTPKEYRFEDIIVLGPERADDYLKKIYGEWKELPPEESRYSTHDYEDLNLNKSYM